MTLFIQTFCQNVTVGTSNMYTSYIIIINHIYYWSTFDFIVSNLNRSSYYLSRVVRKPAFMHMQKQRCRSAAQLISASDFVIRIVQSLYYLNPKFQASIHLLWLYRPVCVGLGRKPRRPVFFTTRLICAQY